MNIYKDVQCNIVMTVKTVTNKGKYNNLLYTYNRIYTHMKCVCVYDIVGLQNNV